MFFGRGVAGETKGLVNTELINSFCDLFGVSLPAVTVSHPAVTELNYRRELFGLPSFFTDFFLQVIKLVLFNACNLK